MALLSGTLSAQSTQAPAASISRNVDEVSLNVAAYMKHGPVLDLTPQDLKVTDAGAPAAISSLRLVRRESEAKLLTLLYDRVDSIGRGNALKITSKILKAIPNSSFDFCVLSVQGQLRLYQEFTSDASLITRAAKEATQPFSSMPKVSDIALKSVIDAAKRGHDASGAPLTAEQRLRAQVLLTAIQDSQLLIDEQHQASSLVALLALVRSEERLPGRKAILFITEDPTFQVKDGALLARIINAATRAGVEIYAFDANPTEAVSRNYLEAFAAVKTAMSVRTNTGVIPTVNPQTAAQTSAPDAPPNVQPPGPPLLGLGDIRTSGMTDFDKRRYDFLNVPDRRFSSSACRVAAYTGGLCVEAGEDPRKAVRRIVKDITTYYALSFVPGTKQFDGRFHRVKLKSLRRGIKLEARSGYFAVPPGRDRGAQDFESPLLNVLHQASLPGDLHFDWRVLQLGEAGQATANVLLVEIPLSQLDTRDDPNAHTYTADVSLLVQIKNMSGQVVDYFAQDLPQHGSLDQKEQGTADNVHVEEPFVANPGEYDVEIAVLDRNSGKAAAVRSKFRVADASRTPYLSDLTLVARMEPMPTELASGEPLRYGDWRAVPELSHELPQGHKQISIFSLVRLDARATAQPRLSVRLVKNGEILAQVPLPLPAAEERGMRAHIATIDTSSLTAGTYQVVEALTQGTKVAESSTDFEIAGPASGSAPHLARLTMPLSRSNRLNPASSGTESSAEITQPLPEMIHEMPAPSAMHPSAEAFQAMVSAAKKYAHRYSQSLPNFICMEVTTRSIDTSGRGDWKTQDRFTDLLGYNGKYETRKLLELNGQRPSGVNTSANSSLPMSIGQFGGLLNLIFNPDSKASFEWQRAAILGGDTVQVFSYVVAAHNTTIGLRAGGQLAAVGFHGLVYTDSATGGIRRITLEADGIPADFPFHATSMMVEYGYVSIAGHEYLLPTHASVEIQRGRRNAELNEIDFRNYSRFGSDTKIVVPAQ